MYLWKHGNYTLLSDFDEKEFVLEARFYFDCEGNSHTM